MECPDCGTIMDLKYNRFTKEHFYHCRCCGYSDGCEEKVNDTEEKYLKNESN